MKRFRILQSVFTICLLLGSLIIGNRLYAQSSDSVQVTSFSAQSDSAIHIADTSIVEKKEDSLKADTTMKGFRDLETKIRWDSLRKVHSPRRAGLYSAIFPGLGQIYNEQYIKVPFMLAGIGVATGVFIFNYNHYITFRDAYRLRLNGQKTGDPEIDVYDTDGLKYIRDGYRKYVDYSVLGFAAVYLYNIIDAVVFGYLYNFHVTSPLTNLKFGPVTHKDQLYAGFGFTYHF